MVFYPALSHSLRKRKGEVASKLEWCQGTTYLHCNLSENEIFNN